MNKWRVVFTISDCIKLSCLVEALDPADATEAALFTFKSSHPRFVLEAHKAVAEGRVYAEAVIA